MATLKQAVTPLQAQTLSAALALGLAVGCGDGDPRPVSFATTNDSTSESGDTDPETSTTSATGDGDPSGDGDGDPSGDGDGDVGDPPEVVSTIPAAGDSAVDPLTDFTVTFASAMDPELLTTNSGAPTCSGGLQISDDGFATCVPLEMGVGAANDDTVFTFTSLAELNSNRAYEFRVADYVATASGAAFGEPWTIETPFATRYYHHIEIDGSNDFDSGDEALPTTSNGHTGYVAWDASYVYLGVEGSEVGSSDPNLFVFAYLGGDGGSTTGINYQGQSPTLPFPARFHPRWKADGTFTNVQEYTGAWDNTALPMLNLEDIAQSGDFIEMRFEREHLGSPASVAVVLGLVREGNNPSTFAGVPSTAFADGFDPNFGSHFEFVFDGETLPNEHSPL